jgi:hypothetical protein
MVVAGHQAGCSLSLESGDFLLPFAAFCDFCEDGKKIDLKYKLLLILDS